MSQYMAARERADGSGIDYPPLLPNDRSNRAEKSMCTLIITLLSVGGASVWYDRGILVQFYYIGCGTLYAILLAGISQVLIRMCLLSEEFRHIPGRYQEYKTAFLAAFDTNKLTICLFGFSFFIILMETMMTRDYPCLYLWSLGAFPNIILFIISYLLSHLIGMEESTLHTSLQIMKMSSLNYGSGMAYNFFYGYLRLILAKHEVGTKSKGLIGRIKAYKDKHHLYERDYEPFPVKKLFILVPQNLYTPTDLQEQSCDDSVDRSKCWMEAAPSLEEEILDRAGVKQRVYKNSVYRIRDPDAEGEPYVYVVAEGATPLKTFWDVIDRNPKMSAFFKEHQAEIVSSFYKTLLEILNDSDDCRGLCEVVYYVDTDVNKRKVNIGKLILERIQELTQRQTHTEMNGLH